MEEVPEGAVGHEVVEEEVAVRGEGVAMEADEVPVPDAPHGLQLRLELPQVIRVRVVELLDGDGLAILQGAPVDGAGGAVPHGVLLVEILCASHDVLVGVDGHVHLQDHQLGRPMEAAPWGALRVGFLRRLAEPEDRHRDHREEGDAP